MMPALFAKAKAQRSTACRKGDDQQRSLPDCTDDCRRQLHAITDELLDRLRAAGEIDPALTTAACHTALFCTVTGGLVALCCSAVSGDALPDLPQNLRDNLHRSLRAGK